MKNGNKLAIVFAIVAVLILGFSLTNQQSYSDDNIELKAYGCKNFDGKKFLLSGGTGTPETIDEIALELQRLNWICNDG